MVLRLVNFYYDSEITLRQWSTSMHTAKCSTETANVQILFQCKICDLYEIVMNLKTRATVDFICNEIIIILCIL